MSLDLTWLRDESLQDLDNLPHPSILAQEMLEELQSALEELSALTEMLEDANEASAGVADGGPRETESVTPPL